MPDRIRDGFLRRTAQTLKIKDRPGVVSVAGLLFGVAFIVIARGAFSPGRAAAQPSLPDRADDTCWTISGNTGVGGVTLSYDDLGPKTTLSDAYGDYSLRVPDGWTGQIRPSLAGYTFAPGIRSYALPVTASLGGQDYAPAAFTPTPTASATGTPTATPTPTSTRTPSCTFLPCIFAPAQPAGPDPQAEQRQQ